MTTADTPPPGTGEQPPQTPGTPDALASFFDSIRRTGIVRADDRWIGGVASGIGLRLGVDALLIRAAFGVLALISGAGFVLYAIGWALLPEARDGRIHLQEAIRGNFDSALIGAGVMFLIGVTTDGGHSGPFGWWLGFGPDWIGSLIGVIVIVALIYFFTTARKQRHAEPGAGAPAPPVVPPPGITTPMSMTKPVVPSPVAPPTPAFVNPVAPATPAKKVKKQKQVRQGPGATSFGIVAGLVLLASAGLMLADRADVFDKNALVTGLGIAAVLAGLAIIVAGLRGRTSGALGFVAIVALFFGLPLASSPDGFMIVDGQSNFIGDATFEPMTATQAEKGYAVGLGSTTIDLTTMTIPSGETVRVPVHMGAGDLEIRVPEDVPISAEVSMGAGDVTWQVDGNVENTSGLGRDEVTFRTDDVADGTAPRIELVISAGVGNILIKEDS